MMYRSWIGERRSQRYDLRFLLALLRMGAMRRQRAQPFGCPPIGCFPKTTALNVVSLARAESPV